MSGLVGLDGQPLSKKIRAETERVAELDRIKQEEVERQARLYSLRAGSTHDHSRAKGHVGEREKNERRRKARVKAGRRQAARNRR